MFLSLLLEPVKGTFLLAMLFAFCTVRHRYIRALMRVVLKASTASPSPAGTTSKGAHALVSTRYGSMKVGLARCGCRPAPIALVALPEFPFLFSGRIISSFSLGILRCSRMRSEGRRWRHAWLQRYSRISRRYGVGIVGMRCLVCAGRM